MELIGNFTALVTPFKRNLTIDFESLKNLCNYQLTNNSDGIVALGSTAETTALDVYEKHKIMETISEAIDNQLPIVAGVNAFTLSDALYQSTARFLDGANALLVSPPPYIKPTDKGLLNYFSQLADYSYIPIILYNIPSRTGTKINNKLITKLSYHPNIIGIKDASGDITFTQNIINETKDNNFQVLSGNDNQLLPILAVGGTGIISVIGNIIPNTIHTIIYDYINNKTESAKSAYFDILNLINVLSLESNPIPIKYAMSKLGLIKPNYREPLCKPTNKTKLLLNSIINSCSLLPKPKSILL